MKCLSLLIACVVATKASSVAKKDAINPAFKDINKGDLGTSINFGLASVDCSSI